MISITKLTTKINGTMTGRTFAYEAKAQITQQAQYPKGRIVVPKKPLLKLIFSKPSIAIPMPVWQMRQKKRANMMVVPRKPINLPMNVTPNDAKAIQEMQKPIIKFGLFTFPKNIAVCINVLLFMANRSY